MEGVAPPRLLVVDAHSVIASALAIALHHAGFPGATSLHPDEVEIMVRTESPSTVDDGVILLGLLHGDGRTALPLIRPLVARGCRVVVMTVDQGLVLMGECLSAGAEAVLDKDMSFERLVRALQQLQGGMDAMDADERLALLEAVERHGAAAEALQQPFSCLTEREAQVLVALIEGRSPKQIAHGHGRSISTVRSHIQQVLGKLDVSSQREALALARHAGWPFPGA